MYIDDGNFKIEKEKLGSPDFIIACEDPKDTP